MLATEILLLHFIRPFSLKCNSEFQKNDQINQKWICRDSRDLRSALFAIRNVKHAPCYLKHFNSYVLKWRGCVCEATIIS